MSISKRTQLALDTLKAGGYFRYALETQYMHGEKFKMRLRTAAGQVVKGVGYQTKQELERHLEARQCTRSSTWGQEWILRAPAPAPARRSDLLNPFNQE